jgi:hypothetical protein
MARKRTPQALRQEAHRLLELAKQKERTILVEVGSLVKQHFDDDFKAFNEETFKTQVSQLLNAL